MSTETAKKEYRNDYGAITFPEKFEMTYEAFKKEYEETHVFQNFHPKSREAELKKAFAIATGKKATE